MLAAFLAFVAILIIAGFAWIVCLTRDIRRMAKTVAYKEAAKARASLPTSER